MHCRVHAFQKEKRSCFIIQTAATEKISLPNLIRTDNKILNKILIALSSLCTEMNKLEKEAITEYYDVFMFYGEGGQYTAIAFVVCQRSRIFDFLRPTRSWIQLFFYKQNYFSYRRQWPSERRRQPAAKDRTYVASHAAPLLLCSTLQGGAKEYHSAAGRSS